jgi:branched-chain amino acid transport system substrate-binding protein
MLTRRQVIRSGAIAAAAAATCFGSGAVAQPKELKVAVIVPLSGPWARGGELMKRGAELAVEDINSSGGVKVNGGIPLRLITIDAGDSADRARNAAQRLLAEHDDVVAGAGAWLSAFTLAITEVTERASLPWITHSFSDQLTDRGFKFIFQTSAGAGRQVELIMPALIELATADGRPRPTKVGLITDNGASNVSLGKALREVGFKSANLAPALDEVFAPPLSDATPLVQRIRSTRPDFVLLAPSNNGDVKTILDKVSEFGLGRGRVPLVFNGGTVLVPEMLNLVGKDQVEGIMAWVANWPTKEVADVDQRYRAKYNEAWMGADSLSAYGDMWLIKQAAEQASSLDKIGIANALRAMDTSEGAAKYYNGHRIRFDQNGKRIDAGVSVAQWQGGVPVAVYPASGAAAAPIWQKK